VSDATLGLLVFVMLRIDYDNTDVLGVFKHREEAERVLAEAKAEYSGYGYEIEEHQLNQRQFRFTEATKT
jgi:hypothetical protein